MSFSIRPSNMFLSPSPAKAEDVKSNTTGPESSNPAVPKGPRRPGRIPRATGTVGKDIARPALRVRHVAQNQCDYY